ncbi:hypothetical protein OROHE_003329 [Orobanche hederae]
MSESIEPLPPPAEENGTANEDNGNPAVVINSVKTDEGHEYSKPVQVEFEDVIEGCLLDRINSSALGTNSVRLTLISASASLLFRLAAPRLLRSAASLSTRSAGVSFLAGAVLARESEQTSAESAPGP